MRRRQHVRRQYRAIIADFLNGLCIVPFLYLSGSVISTTILIEAIRSARLFFAVGGLIGLVFIARELTGRR